MNWFIWSEAIVGHLAWPLSAIVLGLLFRTTLSLLLARMSSAKYGAVELGFTAEVDALKEEAEAAELPQLSGHALPSADAALSAKELPVVIAHLAPLYPAAAFFEAWRAVEAELKAACLRVNLSPTDARKATNALREADYLSADAAHFIHRLRSMRNEVVHADKHLTPAGAYEVAQLAQRALTVLSQIPVSQQHSQTEARRRIAEKN